MTILDILLVIVAIIPLALLADAVFGGIFTVSNIFYKMLTYKKDDGIIDMWANEPTDEDFK